MKRQLIIAFVAILASAVLSACHNEGSTRPTSLVTIRIAGSGRTASLRAEQATAWVRFKHAVADARLMPQAEAVIPATVSSVTVTVQGADMPVQAKTVDTAGMSDVTLTLEVPNGSHREFIVAAFDSPGGNGNYTYWSRTFADLNGTALILPVQMIDLGSVSTISFVSTSGSDSMGDGTEVNPYRTITYALAASQPPSAVLVEAGTYDDTTGGEIFPISLASGNALAGLGANFSTTINFSGDGIYGASQTHVDNIRMLVCDSIGITDQGGIMHINNVLLDGNACGGGAGDAIVLAADSTVSNVIIRDPFSSGITINGGSPVITNSTIVVTGTESVYPFSGIQVLSGSATINNCTISNMFYGEGGGDAVAFSGGTGTVSQCVLQGNGNGVTVQSGSPAISGNMITNNGQSGIDVSGGNPMIAGNTIASNNFSGIYIYSYSGAAAPAATVSGNTIQKNTYGIYVQMFGTSVFRDNRLSCNSSVDFYIQDQAGGGYDITRNSWDHDLSTPVSGPTITSDLSMCPTGIDICYSYMISQPTYSPFNAAVAGGCL